MNITVEKLQDLIPQYWKDFLGVPLLKGQFWLNIVEKLKEGGFTPDFKDIFNAFSLKPEEIKVVILGQDPYPAKGVAHGYSFSTLRPIPASLKKVFEELAHEYEIHPTKADLTPWVKEGVFLLNSNLTTEIGKSNAHPCWDIFTSSVLRQLSLAFPHIVFLGWGSVAKNILRSSKVENVLYAPHPSPMNTKYKFVGCDHFLKANRKLVEAGHLPVRWHAIL
jgi:uracil-DNA glycosylase